MSEALTRPGDFRSAPFPPSMMSTREHPEREIAGQVRGFLAAATLSASLIGAAPILTSPRLSPVPSKTEPEATHQYSPAALTEGPDPLRMEGFVRALNDAIELAEVMVAEDESAPLNPQTLIYAAQILAPLVVALKLPPPLMLPLQNGGIGAEWHVFGMNIELRFRRPYEVYTVLEDALGAIPPYHGRDPYLVQARSALRELRARAIG